LTISSETLGKICTLEWIEISGCCGIEVLPPQVAHQRFLREMYLFCPFLKELPGAMGELSNLVILHLSSSCLELLEIKALVSLEELRTRECVKLKCIQGLAQLTKLRRLDVSNCSELELLETETLVSLEELRTRGCVKLKHIQGLLQLTKLRRLDVANCSELEELEGVPKLVCIIDEKQL
jgi:internalin A